MIRMQLGLDHIPRPDDAADGLAIALCHAHSRTGRTVLQRGRTYV